MSVTSWLGALGGGKGRRELHPHAGVGHYQGQSGSQPRVEQRDGFRITFSSAADVESQDPDSTNLLESEAPRDYFLKCK